MNLLLDTHVLLWWLADDPALPVAARGAITNPDTTVFVSAASVWEISLKQAAGRLDAPTTSLTPPSTTTPTPFRSRLPMP